MEGVTDLEDVLTVVDVKDVRFCGKHPDNDGRVAAAKDGDEPSDIPSALQLFRHLYGEVVWTRPCRKIFALDLALHIVAAGVVTGLLWGHLVVDRLERYGWKIYFFTCMCTLVVLTELASAYLNGALVLRLAGRTQGGISEALLPIWRRSMGSILLVACALGVVRMAFIVANNLVPCSGVLCLPVLLKWCTTRRKRVALTEQLDMVLTIACLEGVSYAEARKRAIRYYIDTWGQEPARRVRVDLVFALAALVLIFGAGLPCIIVGGKQKNEVLKLSGFTVVIWTVAAMQLLRPVAANTYAVAAYLYTQEGKNTVWTRYPALAPDAYVSKCKEAEGQKDEAQSTAEEGKSAYVAPAVVPSNKAPAAVSDAQQRADIENPTVEVN